ncbi:hypothetical protein DUGA2_58890 [Duganella sp. HH101]|nr:hypothetical protein DUGA2_58890 [Duganella sp. HH101]
MQGKPVEVLFEHDPAQRLVQHGRRQRLHQHQIQHPGLLPHALVQRVRALDIGQRDQGRPRAPAQPLHRIPVVHAVEQHQLVRRPGSRQLLRRGGRVGRAIGLAAHARYHRLQQLARLLARADQQDPHRQVRARLALPLRGAAVGDRERERAADAGRAVDPQLAAHQAHQPLADRQAEAGAAEAPRGRAFGLRERIEDAALLLRVDADAGVAHREVQPHLHRVGILQLDAHHHRAALGELDGVAGQVDQHLVEPQRVAHHVRRQRGIEIEQHLDRLALHAGAEYQRQVAQHLLQVERHLLQHQLARFHLGEIQDVVEDAQQRMGRRIGLVDIVALLRAQRRQPQQVLHAEDAVHRRADLMAHGGQELALHARGGLGPVALDQHRVALARQLLGALAHARLQRLAALHDHLRHVVERARGLGDLVVARHLQLAAQLAGRDHLRAVRELGDLAYQIASQQQREQRHQHHLQRRQRQAPAPRLGQGLLQAGDIEPDAHAAVMDAAHRHRAGDGEHAVAGLVQRGVRHEGAVQRRLLPGLGQHALLGVEHLRVQSAFGAAELARERLQALQVVADDGVARHGGEGLGRHARMAQHLLFVGFAQEMQHAEHQHPEQQRLDQRDAEDGLGAETQCHTHAIPVSGRPPEKCPGGAHRPNPGPAPARSRRSRSRRAA